MAIKKCEKCGKNISDKAFACPFCQNNLTSEESASGNIKEPANDTFTFAGMKTNLIICKDCGRKISKNAEKCPHCGATLKKKTSFVAWAFFLFLLYIIWGPIGSGYREPATRKVQASSEEIAVRIIDFNWHKDRDFSSNGSVIWNVEVENTTDSYIRQVKVEFTTYDDEGRLIDSDYTFVSGLQPKGRGSKKSFATYYGNESKGRVRVVR